MIPDSASKRHGTGCMLLEIGGAATFLKYAALESLMTNQGPNKVWYSPVAPNTGGWPNS
jgi:hypothetical protein